MSQSAAPVPLAQEAQRRIIAMIFEGTLRPGAPLREAALGEMFGMSRTPVREAVRRLESEGLAGMDGRFARVRGVTAGDVEEIFFLRLELEPPSARSAVRLPPGQVDAMEAQVRALMASDPAINDLQWQTDHDFHRMLGRESGNQAIAATIAVLHRRTCVFDHSQVPDRFLKGCEEHLHILDAIRSGNADAVEARVRRHLENARDAVLRRLDETQERQAAQ